MKDLRTEYDKFKKILAGYSDRVSNFMQDCVYIANSKGENGIKGFPAQGFNLTLAACTFDDSFHLGYEKGSKGVDVFCVPYANKVNVVLYGFNPEDKYSNETKTFQVEENADKFADFVESLATKSEGNHTMHHTQKCSMLRKQEALNNDTTNLDSTIEEGLKQLESIAEDENWSFHCSWKPGSSEQKICELEMWCSHDMDYIATIWFDTYDGSKNFLAYMADEIREFAENTDVNDEVEIELQARNAPARKFVRQDVQQAKRETLNLAKVVAKAAKQKAPKHECSMLRKKMECMAKESVYSEKGFPKQDGVYDLTIRDKAHNLTKHIEAEWSSYLMDWKGYVVDSSIEVLDYKFLHK